MEDLLSDPIESHIGLGVATWVRDMATLVYDLYTELRMKAGRLRYYQSRKTGVVPVDLYVRSTCEDSEIIQFTHLETDVRRRNCKSSNKTDSITLDEDKSEQLEIDFSTINYNEASYSNYISGGGNKYEEGDTDSNSTISNQPEDNNPTDQEIIEPYSTGWDQDSDSEILVVKATSNSE
nr:8677_t:CDS:2 [Entrophospora candida]